MFEKHSDGGYTPAAAGIERKTLVHGEKTLMAKFLLNRGSVIPLHAHPHEQIGYLLKGHLRFTVGAEKWDAGTGDSWCIPGGIEHQADVIEESVVVEVFSPVREDFLSSNK